MDGKVYYRENSRMHPIEVSVTAENRIRSMIAIRECVRRLIEYQTEGYPDEDIQKEQAELNRLYDDYTKNTACFPAGVTAWPLARTPAIACCVLWRYWTRKATSTQGGYVHQAHDPPP